MKYLKTKHKLDLQAPIKKGLQGDIFIPNPENIIFRGQTIAELLESDQDLSNERGTVPFSIHSHGQHINFLPETGKYISQSYGLLYADNKNNLSVIIPIRYNKRKTKAYLYVFCDLSGKLPTAFDIQGIQRLLGIQQQIPEEKILSQINGLDVKLMLKSKKAVPILIAEGFEAQNGNPKYFTFYEKPHIQSGLIKKDGTIDYHERNFICQVKKGTAIAKEIPMVETIDGMDIFGNTIKAKITGKSDLKPGKNIIPNPENALEYIAAIDGRLIKRSLSIDMEDSVTISGDVDYSTGNIQFLGNVEIKGSIMPGFQVHAGGNLIVRENIDDAVVSAKNDLFINGGIQGKERSSVHVGGNLTAKYLRNANVHCDGNIQITGSIIHSKVMANGTIKVVSDKAGKIIGGEVIAKLGIEVNTVGSESGQQNFLGAGMDPELIEKYKFGEKILEELKDAKEEIWIQIQQNFDEAFIKNPKKFIEALPTYRKKQYINFLKDLKELNDKIPYQEFILSELTEKMKVPDDTSIQVHRVIYPVTRIQIKETQCTITNKEKGNKFNLLHLKGRLSNTTSDAVKPKNPQKALEKEKDSRKLYSA